jgi:hypothetical protein
MNEQYTNINERLTMNKTMTFGTLIDALLFQKLHNEAHEAGIRAVENMILKNKIVPMVIIEHSNMMDDNSPVKRPISSRTVYAGLHG